ncbi:retron Ec67 family RNA-directed DNA polymerase/endonuclease [Sphingomonas sp.]|uniref:retron Ec67 family RNA-directed DNA polymerase/endonuclease n=1 Tax=Sphingomonas sp. TaxID=28214 RepID=UPI002FD8CB49
MDTAKSLDILYAYEDDLYAAGIRQPNLDHGFRRGTNIYYNARVHQKRLFVLNIDLENYFDQFNFGRVRGFFIKNEEFRLHPAVATVIAQIVCHDDKLPQGAPTSPHVANLMTRFLDRRLTRFLRARKCAYSRYADDITISTNMPDFPSDVAVPDAGAHGWALAPEICDIFARSSLPLNNTKTRMSITGSRQMVTGLVVNSHPNVTREYYLNTRAMCHHLFRTGKVTIPHFTGSFADNCPKDDAQSPDIVKDPIKSLEGRLSYIHYLRERRDPRTTHDKQDAPTQFRNTLQLFYLYKYFIGNDVPTVLTEGPSDIYYLKSAIAKSTLNLPKIKSSKENGEKPKISFFRFDKTAADVIGLTGGSGNIKRFLYLLNAKRSHFNMNLRKQPVIIVIDNDSGGKDVIAQINGMYKKNISSEDPQPVHRISPGLTLVKTPHTSSKKLTCIEDFLPADVISVELKGKSFSSSNKKMNTDLHFGKIALAHYVRDNIDSISFAGFDPLLQALDDAVALGVS